MRSVMGWVTMLMLAMPETRRESMTEQKAPKGTVSSARGRRRRSGCLDCFADFGGELVNVDGIVAEIDELIFVDGDDEFCSVISLTV